MPFHIISYIYSVTFSFSPCTLLSQALITSNKVNKVSSDLVALYAVREEVGQMVKGLAPSRPRGSHVPLEQRWGTFFHQGPFVYL